MKEYLEIGKIVSTHGVKGEVKVYPLCDDPLILTEIDSAYLGEQYLDTEIEWARVNKGMVIMKLLGVDDLNSASILRDSFLYAHREDFTLEENTYFIADLIGLTVIDVDDNSITYGKIVDVTQTGANDVYHIKAGDGRLLLAPAIASVVISTDVENGVMQIRPLKGLFE